MSISHEKKRLKNDFKPNENIPFYWNQKNSGPLENIFDYIEK